MTFSSELNRILKYELCAPLRAAVAPFAGEEWPGVERYIDAACASHAPILSGAGMPVSFVPETSRGLDGFKRLYQARIFLTGEVSTRARHWHDFFNMLIWMNFPLAKAALNRRHFFAFDEQAEFPWTKPPLTRTREQDALTIFDEGGMVVLCCDAELKAEALRIGFPALFKKDAEAVKNNFCSFVFGHAVYEELIKKHFNVSASALLLDAPRDILSAEPAAQLLLADTLAAEFIGNRKAGLTPKVFAPFPVARMLGLDENYAEIAHVRTANHIAGASAQHS